MKTRFFVGMIVVCAAMVLATGAFATYSYVDEWGSFGSGNGEFDRPNGIAINDSGTFYVCDRWNNRIQILDSNGTYTGQWGGSGSGDGKFNEPNGIAINSLGDVYVVDRYNHRIQIFDYNGDYIGQWGSNGSGNGEFDRPVGIAIDSSDSVYVADENNSRIQKFKGDGTFVTKWTVDNFPYGVDVDSSGYVYAASHWGHFVAKYELTEGDTYTEVLRWGTQGHGDGQFYYPISVTVDSDGNIYVTNSEDDRVQKFTNDGTFITSWGSTGTGAGEFDTPWDIAVDSMGIVYVTEQYNHRIQLFAPEPVASIAEVKKFRVSWNAIIGLEYQVQGSIDMQNWENIGTPIVADEEEEAIFDETWLPRKNYRVLRVN